MSNEEIFKLQDELIKRLIQLNVDQFDVNACIAEIQLLKDYQLLYNLNKLTHIYATQVTPQQSLFNQYVGGAWSCDSGLNKEYGSRCSESEIGSPTKMECEILCLAQHEKVATYENIIKFIIDRNLEFVIPINYLKDMLTGGTAKNAEFQRFKISRWYLGVREMIWHGPLDMGEIIRNRLGTRVDKFYIDSFSFQPITRTMNIIIDSDEDLANFDKLILDIEGRIQDMDIDEKEIYRKLKKIRNSFIMPNKIIIDDPQIIDFIKRSRFSHFFIPELRKYSEWYSSKAYYKHDVNTPVDIMDIKIKTSSSAHANCVIIDYYRKRIIHIEPWVIGSLGIDIVRNIFQKLFDDLGYEYVSAETLGCPIGLQGIDNELEDTFGGFCQTWAPFITIMSILNPTKLDIDYLIGMQQNATDLLIMFLFYIYDVYGKAARPFDFAKVISIKDLQNISSSKCAIIDKIKPLIDAITSDWQKLNPIIEDYISLLSLKDMLTNGNWCNSPIINNDIRVNNIINMFDSNRFPLLHARATSVTYDVVTGVTSATSVTYDNSYMQEAELQLERSINSICNLPQMTPDLNKICTIIRRCKLAINIDYSNRQLQEDSIYLIDLSDLIDQYKKALTSGKMTYQDFESNYKNELLKIFRLQISDMPTLKNEIVLEETVEPLVQPSTCIIL